MEENSNPQGFSAEQAAAYEAMKNDAPMETPDEPKEAPAVEPEEAKQPEPKADKPPPGMVPHGALHAERESRKAAESELQQLRAKLAVLELAQNQKSEPEQPAAPPDMFTDPEGYSKWVQDLASAPQRSVAELQEQMRAQAEQQMLSHALANDAAAFVAERPDYQAAEAHLIKARIAELQLLYPTESPAAVAAHVAQERLGLVRQAQQVGMRPAEFIYNVATHRGYAPPAPKPAIDPAAAAQMKAKAAAQQATQSLASAPANAGAGDLTMEGIAKMSPAEYAKLKADRPDDVRRVMQGA